MRDVIEMAREADLIDDTSASDWYVYQLARFADLVRADEREQGQRWFDAVTAQHKQAILAEREACAKVCEDSVEYAGDTLADAIRARSNT
jgi:hypothetical protein